MEDLEEFMRDCVLFTDDYLRETKTSTESFHSDLLNTLGHGDSQRQTIDGHNLMEGKGKSDVSSE